MTNGASGPDAAGNDGNRRVFFAFDFTDLTTRAVVDDILDEPIEGIDARGGADPGGQGEIWQKVEAEIRSADALAALLDHANANVGFELGFALGLGKQCYLGQSRAVSPPWTERAPLKNFLRAAASDRDQIATMLANDGTVVPREMAPGDGTIFLCPNANLGVGILKRLPKEQPTWRVLDPTGWNLAELAERLAGAWRVVWVILDFDPTVERRDGSANAAHGVVAGFASALGFDLRVYVHEAAREVVDVAGKRLGFDTSVRLYQLLGELNQTVDADRAQALDRIGGQAPGAATAPATPTDPISAYRKWIATAHATTVPFFGNSARALRDVFVGLNVRMSDSKRFAMRGESERDEIRRLDQGLDSTRLTLETLMAIPTNEDLGITRRWVLLGDPGSGKSTICRRLACELARDDKRPLPLFVSLARLAAPANSDDPFALVAKDAARTEDVDPADLAAALRERAKAGAVWILLDGLDEVLESDAPRVPEILGAIADAHPDCPMLVTSRRTGYAGAPTKAFVGADLLPLDPTAQRALLENWLGTAEAQRAWERLQHSPRLTDLASNPFLLTLLAQLHRERVDLPKTRGQLYDRAIKLLLTRGFGTSASGVKSHDSAAALLTPLSLKLQEAGGESWPRDEVHRALVQIIGSDELLATTLRVDWPDGTGTFLDDIERNAGVVGPHDGATSGWRYLHRSLREYLAAKALHADTNLDVDRLIAHLEADEGTARWGETVGLLVGMLEQSDPRRRALLEAVTTRDHDLAHRTLPQLEGLEPAEALELIDRVPPETGWSDKRPWNGVDLAEVLRNLRLDNADCDEVRRLVMAPIDASTSTEDLAHRYYGLEVSGVGVDRAAFFRRCGRWPADGEPNLPVTVRIPPGTADSVDFVMGSPEGVGNDDERPQRNVTLTVFEIGKTQVTESEYAAFDPGREATGSGLPVANVSWWESWLYARWVGGRLPTEAEWECAARAGTSERWSHGDVEGDRGRYAWFDENSDGERHEVGTKAPNPWGLSDTHGNVLEWCLDWKGEYEETQTADPAGSAAGTDRVLRGGSAWDDADLCRSAYRYGFRPWGRGGVVGFRVVLPSS